MVQSQHDAARAIQRSWRSTAFLVKSLKLNFKDKVEAVRRKPAIAAAKALAARLNGRKPVVYLTHVRPLLYLRWAAEKPKSLMSWEHEKLNNCSAYDTAMSLHEAALTFDKAEAKEAKQAYANYIEKFTAWRFLDCAQKCTVLRCVLATHVYARSFGPLLSIVCLPREAGDESLSELVGQECMQAIEKELGQCKTMSSAQISHELFHARRGKELIDPNTGFGYEENACFMLVRLRFPPSLYAAIDKDLANRVSQNAAFGALDCDPLLRALHEIQNTAVVSSIGGGWNFDLVAVKAHLTLKPYCLDVIESVLDAMLEAIRLNPGASALTWPSDKAITSKIAFLMRTVGQMQACAFNMRLQILAAPMMQCALLPSYPPPLITTATSKWLKDAQRFRAANREGNKMLRSLDFETSLVGYAVTWLVFAGMDNRRADPETMQLFDAHRLRFLEKTLASIIESVGKRVEGIWTGASGGMLFEKTLFRHVHHNADFPKRAAAAKQPAEGGGEAEGFMAKWLNKSRLLPPAENLMQRIDDFTDKMRDLVECSKTLYGANTYLPIIDRLFVR